MSEKLKKLFPDLKATRTQSKALCDEDKTVGGHEEDHFIRFSAQRYLAEMLRLGVHLREEADVDVDAMKKFGAQGWLEYLDWCLYIARCETAFLLDPDGLPIAFRGVLPEKKILELGLGVIAILEKADDLKSGRAKSVVIEYSSYRIHLFRVYYRYQYYHLGLIGPEILKASAIASILEKTKEKLRMG